MNNTNNIFVPSRIVGSGSFPIDVMLRYKARCFETGQSADTIGQREGLVFETAQTGKNQVLSLHNGAKIISLTEGEMILIPPQSTAVLEQECLRHKNTQVYARRLKHIATSSSGDGAGGDPIVSLTAMLAILPMIRSIIDQDVLSMRERRVLDHAARQGRLDHEAPNRVIIVINGSGATGNGTAALIATLYRQAARKFGLVLEIIVMATTPSASSGGDVLRAKGNFASFCRQAAIGMTQPQKIVFHTLAGDDIRPDGPIYDRLCLFGPSSGKVTVGTRSELAAQVAMACWLMTRSPYAAHADAQFRDFANDRADERFGFRGFARLGVTMVSLDHERAEALAMASGMERAADLLLGISKN